MESGERALVLITETLSLSLNVTGIGEKFFLKKKFYKVFFFFLLSQCFLLFLVLLVRNGIYGEGFQ